MLQVVFMFYGAAAPIVNLSWRGLGMNREGDLFSALLDTADDPADGQF